jgi:cation diffusion facilitator CzcD-associated flavoprotein CzcO
MIPAWPGLKDFAGELVHSDEFTDALPYRDRDVLVVGAGNSGADIAVQLADIGARRVWLAVRTPPHLVRRAVETDPFRHLPRDICPGAVRRGGPGDRSAAAAHRR